MSIVPQSFAWPLRAAAHLMRVSSSTPIRTKRRMIALPSKRRLGSFSSSLRSSRAARRILERTRATRQISCLERRPYSPASLSSESRREDSYGRRGTLYVLDCLRGALGLQKMEREDGSVECSQRRWVGVSSSNQQQQRSPPQLFYPLCSSCTRSSRSREAGVESSLIVTSLTKLPSARRDYHLSLFLPTLHQERDTGAALDEERFAMSAVLLLLIVDDVVHATTTSRRSHIGR